MPMQFPKETEGEISPNDYAALLDDMLVDTVETMGAFSKELAKYSDFTAESIYKRVSKYRSQNDPEARRAFNLVCQIIIRSFTFGDTRLLEAIAERAGCDLVLRSASDPNDEANAIRAAANYHRDEAESVCVFLRGEADNYSDRWLREVKRELKEDSACAAAVLTLAIAMNKRAKQ